MIEPCPNPFNLAAYVLAAGADTPDKMALDVLGGAPQSWTYARLIRAVRGTASGLLAQGLAPGDRVLLRLGNTADFPIAYLGAIAAGLVAVPTSSALTETEITAMTRMLAPAVVLQDAALAAPQISGLRSIGLGDLQAMYDLPAAAWHMGDPERPAYIVFTSGTSGTARAVVHAHRAIWARRMMHQGWYGLRRADRLLHAGAFNWTFTLGTGLMDPWTLGASALIPVQGTPARDLAALLARHDATLFAAAPGVYRKMMQAPMPPMPKLRHGLSAGEKMLPQLHRQWQQATGLHIYEAFGMSECSTFISSSAASPCDPEALGRPQTGRRTALLDPDGHPAKRGMIAVHRSDPGLMLGYLDAPAQTKARFSGEWFVTGDLGRTDDTGAIYYEGRADDMMNAGGFRLSPLEVEAAFLGQLGITQCAACEMTLKPGVQIIALGYSAPEPLAQSDLQALASRQLADYKRPRIYVQCDTLPTSANGKLLRRVLRSQLEATHGQT